MSHENKVNKAVIIKPEDPTPKNQEEETQEKEVSQQKPPPDDPPQKVETPTSSWRSWGAFNAISNASKTVASITTQVSQSIMDSINIPEPEQMAKMQAEESKKEVPDESSANYEKRSEKSEDSMFKLDSLISGVTQISSKVVSGGLDTLEGIGKKTINILHETDPTIKSKIRNINNKPNLSDLLKEAKERDDEVSASAKDTNLKSVSFEYLLDEYKGLVYLEALQILSNQSKMKIELLMKPLSGRVLTEVEETIAEVKELCEFDAENFDEAITAEKLEDKLQAATKDTNVKVNFSEIVNYSKETEHWFEDLDSSLKPHDIYEKSIQVMANLCALSLNNLQKFAELLLSQDRRLTADEADALTE